MTKAEPRAAEGAFEGKAFVFPVRVYYEDTDFSGVVYHASYLRFMERGRSEFLRVCDVRHQGLLEAEEPLAWAVRRILIDYGKPARVDDLLHVRTAVAELTGARMRLEQTVLRGTAVLVNAEVEVCLIALNGRPRRIAGIVREKLEAFLPR